jgi:citronellol/citronellal dehydrogenase
MVVKTFGGIDILVNNASAINLSPTEQTEPKRYDLLQDINVRGTFFLSQACIPHLKKAINPHILNLSPPLRMDPQWFSKHLAYTLSKYGMSMIVLGLAEELKPCRIGVNALWPRTTIATAAVQNLLGGDFLIQRSRKPEIVADAAAFILRRPSYETTGQFFIDEEVLMEEGISDFGAYAVNPEQKLMNDLFL